MDSAVTTGAFALGGVALGGGLDWVRASLASKRAEVGRRDELIAALDAACISLMTEVRACDDGSELARLLPRRFRSSLTSLPAVRVGCPSGNLSRPGICLVGARFG